jgi:hypothetical protein
LTNLVCTNCNLSKLDVSADTALTNLECYNNQLDTLDVRTNLKLISLLCNDNLLISLDVSKNTSLTTLDCTNNTGLPKVCISTSQLALKNSTPANWSKPSTATWSTSDCADTMVEIDEPINNNAPTILLHIYNLLGQEVGVNDIMTGVIYIYQYSDGSVKKIVRI